MVATISVPLSLEECKAIIAALDHQYRDVTNEEIAHRQNVRVWTKITHMKKLLLERDTDV